MNSGPTAETVRENVTRLRKEAGMGFAELSRELESRGRPIPPLGLRRIESGERRVDVDDLTALAFAFGVNPHALLLPHRRSDEIRCEVTGQHFPPQPTADVWAWAEGQRPFLSIAEVHQGFAEGGQRFMQSYVAGFRARVQPRTVLSHEARAERRARWVEFEISKLEDELTHQLHQHGEQRQNSGFTDTFEAEAAKLRALDPTDDDAWALQPYDPAPPELSELADA